MTVKELIEKLQSLTDLQEATVFLEIEDEITYLDFIEVQKNSDEISEVFLR